MKLTVFSLISIEGLFKLCRINRSNLSAVKESKEGQSLTGEMLSNSLQIAILVTLSSGISNRTRAVTIACRTSLFSFISSEGKLKSLMRLFNLQTARSSLSILGARSTSALQASSLRLNILFTF